jgi:predicted secreted hydrolase
MRKGNALLFALLLVAAAVSGQDDGDRPAERSRLSELLGGGDFTGFEKAIEPREFVFPRDHGPHPEFRNEWWYLTGNLDDEHGRRFGFELTFFRFALTPDVPEPDSNWRSKQIYAAHFAITDADRKRFYVAQKFSRAALGLAGAAADPFRVWIDDWRVAATVDTGEQHSGEQWQLSAADDDFGLNISLSAVKPAVLHGDDGLSQKSAEPGNASYYYSMTRWNSSGRLRIGSDVFNVSGLSWLDREWSSSALSPQQKGWDWFALQLSDGSELMFYNIRRTDGGQDEHSAGTWISASGESTSIRPDEIDIAVTDNWRSPEGGSYPAGWTVVLREFDLKLNIVPVMNDQELITTVRYWEGAVDVSGDRDGTFVDGRGYVELTGYAD